PDRTEHGRRTPPRVLLLPAHVDMPGPSDSGRALPRPGTSACPVCAGTGRAGTRWKHVPAHGSGAVSGLLQRTPRSQQFGGAAAVDVRGAVGAHVSAEFRAPN